MKSGTLNKTNTVLLVIDFQERFVPVIHAIDSVLKNAADTVLVCGIESHICVCQTVLDLLINDYYNVHVITDGISSRKLSDHQTSFKRMSIAGKEVLNMRYIQYLLFFNNKFCTKQNSWTIS